MRWFCVHPNLPLQAELRVRTSPDSSAIERARIPQGRAIASCSPVFQVPGDGVDAAPISWLQVAYHDALSGETEGGFMMAALPDGTPLVTPWESTDFYSCCEVTDPAALQYDGPHETAKSFGPVQSVNFLYCIVEEAEKRVRLFHPELENVWIEKKDVHMVCTRFKHAECSTPHTFFELSEALPEEAQIAIREYPSKEAQTVGLLSRGETVEVTVRGGNWLQIAGGSIDKAWIMWRTDALELLQEAPDVCSSTCVTIAANVNSLADSKNLAEANPDQSGDSEESTHVTPATSTGSVQDDADMNASGTKSTPVEQSWDVRSPLAALSAGVDNENDGSRKMVMEVDDMLVNRCNNDSKTPVQACTAVAQAECNDVTQSDPKVNESMEREEAFTHPDERPIHPTRDVIEEERADAASVEVVEDSGAFVPGDVGMDRDTECSEVMAAVTSPDERPIRPAQNVVEEETNAASVEVVEDSGAVACAGASADASASEPDGDDSMEREEAFTHPDERPIHPTRDVIEEERADAASVEVVEDSGAFVPGDVGMDRDTECSEVMAAVTSPDERPIRPAQNVVEEETNAASVEVVEDSGAVACAGASADASASEPDGDDSMEREEAFTHPDERPIHPTRDVIEEERADAASVEVVEDSGAFVPGDVGMDRDTECSEVMAAVTSPDERPIRPAQNVVEEETNAASVEVVEDSGAVACAGASADASASEPDGDDSMEREEAFTHPDERPIHPTRDVIEEERADAASVEVVEDSGAFVPGDVGMDRDTECSEVMAAVTSPDERPIRPAQNVVEEETNAASVEVVEDSGAVACAGASADASASEPDGDDSMEREEAFTHPDERPIHPTRDVIEEERADAASVEVVEDSGAFVPGDVGMDRDTECSEVMAAVTSPDERPIRPAQNVVEEETNAASVEVVEDSGAVACAGASADASASEPDGDDSMEREEVFTHPDERPIHPTRDVIEEERADAASVEVVEDSGAFVPGDVGMDRDTECSEVMAAVTSPDERPIRPAQNVVEEETNAASVEVVEDSGAVACAGASADASASEPDGDDSMEREEAFTHPDERPIHPTRDVIEEERADAASVEVVEDSGAFVPGDVGMDRDTECSEVMAAVTSPDERPIRPAQNVVEEETNAASVKVMEDSGAGTDFVHAGNRALDRDAVAKAALSARIFGTIGSSGSKAESNSESEAGDIAVLGGLDDVFDPVDELIVDTLAEDTTKAVDTCAYALKEESEQSTGDEDNSVTTSSFSLIAQEKADKKDVEGTDNAALFLQEFGITKYCERKQSLYPVSDRLSRAMFNADQDDADLVFEVLVGDDPLSDEWFHDVTSRHYAATLHSVPRTAVLKLSLSGDSGDTYTLIMGDATPEAILESGLLDDNDGDYDLVRSFRYPLPTRRLGRSGKAPSPLRAQSSSALHQHKSAHAENSTVNNVKPPSSPTQSVVPPSVSAASSGLAQRKSIGAPSSIAKPPSAVVRPRPFVRTPMTPSTMAVKPSSSRLTQPSSALSGTPSSVSKTTKSFLPTPSPHKVPNISTNAIPKPVESSGLPTPRMSFGFRRLPKN